MNVKKMTWEQTKKTKEQGGNLNPINSPEMAEEYRRRSMITRQKNKERREMAKAIMKDYEDMKAVDLLRMEMAMRHANGEIDEALVLAEKLAPYETPKLSSQQVDLTTQKYEEMSDEEFEQELKELEKEDEIRTVQ